MQTMIGVFSSKAEADNAVEHLKDIGYQAGDISIVVKDNIHIRETVSSKGGMAAHGAVSGAAAGGVIGGIAGLLIGIGAVAIPGVGALFIAGPLATALGLTGAAATTVSGVATGLLAGGVLGALSSLGIPEGVAKMYAERISQGAVLLAVPIEANVDPRKVRKVFDMYHAEQIRTIDTVERG